MQDLLAEGTLHWGVQVERVEVKDVRVPEQLMRAMAAEAEAAREARAKVIAAEGEHKASKALSNAAQNIVRSPAALQLRYLQVGTSSLQAVASCNCADSELDLRREELDHNLPAADGDRERVYRTGRGV